MSVGRMISGLLLVAVLAGPTLLVPPPAMAAEEFKVGYVDIGRVFDEYERTKRSESILERKGQQKEDELEKRLGSLRKLRGGLELLSDSAREKRSQEIDEKADELRRFGKYTKRELLLERDRVAKDILEDIQQAIDDYASANGFSLILDQRLLLYGQAVHDVTGEVLKQLNARDMARANRR